MPASPTGRLLSLDVMRGATILAMILVNNPGTWSALYRPLGHADWDGWTPTDLIFPFFVFMVGVAMAFSFAKYTTGDDRPTTAVWMRIVRRVVVLILLGLLLQGGTGLFERLLGKPTDFSLATLRWPGVLPRIALAYLGASLVVLLLPPKGRWVAAALLLGGYWGALKLLPTDVPPSERMSPTANVVRAVDVALIGESHMWTQATTRPTDPEGLLSTLPAIITALIGLRVGRVLKQQPATTGLALRMIGVGLAVALAGQLLDRYAGMPINKALWTPTFVLLTGGLGTAALGLLVGVFDVWGVKSPALRRVATAFEMVGVNAIVAFVAASLGGSLLGVLTVGDLSLKDWLYTRLFAAPLGGIDPRLASVAYAATYVGCWWLVLWGMWRRGWTVRV